MRIIEKKTERQTEINLYCFHDGIKEYLIDAENGNDRAIELLLANLLNGAWYGLPKEIITNEIEEIKNKVHKSKVKAIYSGFTVSIPLIVYFFNMPQNIDFLSERASDCFVYLDNNEQGWRTKPWNKWAVQSIIEGALFMLILREEFGITHGKLADLREIYKESRINKELNKKRKTKEYDLLLAALLTSLYNGELNDEIISYLEKSIGMAYRHCCIDNSMNMLSNDTVIVAAYLCYRYRNKNVDDFYQIFPYIFDLASQVDKNMKG